MADYHLRCVGVFPDPGPGDVYASDEEVFRRDAVRRFPDAF